MTIRASGTKENYHPPARRKKIRGNKLWGWCQNHLIFSFITDSSSAVRVCWIWVSFDNLQLQLYFADIFSVTPLCIIMFSITTLPQPPARVKWLKGGAKNQSTLTFLSFFATFALLFASAGPTFTFSHFLSFKGMVTNYKMIGRHELNRDLSKNLN